MLDIGLVQISGAFIDGRQRQRSQVLMLESTGLLAYINRNAYELKERGDCAKEMKKKVQTQKLKVVEGRGNLNLFLSRR